MNPCFKYQFIFKPYLLPDLTKSKTYTYRVPDDFEDKIRLQEFVVGLFPYLETRSAVKKAIKKKQIKLNDKIGHTGDWVTAGCELKYELIYELVKSGPYNVDILYKDRFLMIVRKPPGISSSGNQRSFQHHLKSIELDDAEDSLPYPYLVHRLDKATEGLMLAANTMNARRKLATILTTNQIIKHYVLIVEGRFPDSVHWLDKDLDDKPAKTEITKTEYLKTKDPTTKVFVCLHSGRTHQIRRHFSEVGFPIIGDNLYNKEGLNFRTGLLLCAYYLEFIHPITQELVKVEYPIPDKINKYHLMDNE